MTARPASYATRPRISPDLLSRFAAYRNVVGGEWGSLHVVLADGNYGTEFAAGCVEWAESNGDIEGAELARILASMSKTQQKRIGTRLQ